MCLSGCDKDKNWKISWNLVLSSQVPQFEDCIVCVTNTELQKENVCKPHHYVPHFNTSQSKFRVVVYDVAREYKEVSLKSLFERGPIFMQSLKSILIRFREKIHGIAGDVANMYNVFSNTNCIWKSGCALDLMIWRTWFSRQSQYVSFFF